MLLLRILSPLLLLLTTFIPSSLAIDLDVNDNDSIQKAQIIAAEEMLDYYNPNSDKEGNEVGMMQPPYYWWESGVAWWMLLNTYYTNDNKTMKNKYKKIVKDAFLAQTGPNWDYLPASQASTEGNDDQGFWGVAAMDAAEKNFSNPGSDEPQWLYLAQSVFNTMSVRWETGSCGGGLRWQIYPWNGGWTYKNSVSNGCLFHIGARLARYTGNSSYMHWAEKVWDWEEDVKLLDHYFSNDTLSVFDGAHMAKNCSDTSRLEWTYNSGLFISGCAYLYNHTNDTIWLDRAQKIWNRAKVFFKTENKIMYEAACQPSNQCNNDQRSFKGIFSAFLGLTVLMSPGTSFDEEIWEYLQNSAKGAAQSCTGGYSGTTCGLNWFYTDTDDKDFVPSIDQVSMIQNDGEFGLGEQICALGVFNSLLVHTKPGPLSEKTGATSKGDGHAGLDHGDDDGESTELILETKDKAGAGVITAVVVLVQIGVGVWLLL